MQTCCKLTSIFSIVYVTVPSMEVGKKIARLFLSLIYFKKNNIIKFFKDYKQF